MQASTLKILKIHEMTIKSILPQQDWHFKNPYTIILPINRNIGSCPTDNEFFTTIVNKKWMKSLIIMDNDLV